MGTSCIAGAGRNHICGLSVSCAQITFRLTNVAAGAYAGEVKLHERMRRAHEQANAPAQKQEHEEESTNAESADAESTNPYDALRELNTQEAHAQLQELIMPRQVNRQDS